MIVQNTGQPVFLVLSVFLTCGLLPSPLSYCFLFLCRFFFFLYFFPFTVCQGGCVFLWLSVHVKIIWRAKKYESSTQLNSEWVVILQTSTIFTHVMTKFHLNEKEYGRNVKILVLAGLQRKYVFKFVFAACLNHENWFKKTVCWGRVKTWGLLSLFQKQRTVLCLSLQWVSEKTH